MADNSFPFPPVPDPPGGLPIADAGVPIGSVPWPGDQPPTDRPAREGPPSGDNRRKLVIFASVSMVALVGIGVGVAVAAGSDTSRPSAASRSSGSATARTGSPIVAAVDSDAASATPTGEPPTTEASQPSLPDVSVDMDMQAVQGVPQLAAVAHVLDTYFSGINSHNGALAASVFTADGSINPHSAKAVARFQHEIHTSHDDRIVIVSIRPAPVGVRSGLVVHVMFRSRQASAYGPNQATCTNWTLDYRMPYDRGVLKLKDSVDVSNVDCQ